MLGWPLFIVGMTVFRGGGTVYCGDCLFVTVATVDCGDGCLLGWPLFIVVIVCLLGWPLFIVG